jgi:hypothetical protein
MYKYTKWKACEWEVAMERYKLFGHDNRLITNQVNYEIFLLFIFRFLYFLTACLKNLIKSYFIYTMFQHSTMKNCEQFSVSACVIEDDTSSIVLNYRNLNLIMAETNKFISKLRLINLR